MGTAAVAPSESRRHQAILAGVLLFLSVLVVYFPVGQHEFIVCDDNDYVTTNPDVQKGLTRESVVWAFTSRTAANWHPLTMLSLELDWVLYGNRAHIERSAPGFHLTNLFLHTANTLLLFIALLRMTGCIWRCAWVAALFALHPLHVESVAWVAERKDVLCSLFWMITLLAYVYYARAPSWLRMAGVSMLLVLGLMAKPMLVTLPFVFLLLDFWPLRRFSLPGVQSPQADRGPFAAYSAGRLLLEKLPLIAISAAFCVITLVVQSAGDAIRSLGQKSLLLRLDNAALAPVFYLGKMVWPADLAAFYPIPREGFPAWQVAGAILLLLAITALVWRERGRRPYLLVGWAWYLGTLVPVSGLVQVGEQAWADRYTYIPLVGIFVALAWEIPDLLGRCGFSPRAVACVAGVTVALCVVPTRIQIGYWHDDVSLWEHTLAVTTGNYFAHNNLGVYLARQKRTHAAIDHFAAAVAAKPLDNGAWINLCRSLKEIGKPLEARKRLEEALQVHPENTVAHIELGLLLAQQGERQEAMRHWQEAIRLYPQDWDSHLNMAGVLHDEGHLEDAERHLVEVTRLVPLNPEGHHQLGSVLYEEGRTQDAIASYRQAVELRPKNLAYRLHLALALYESGLTESALTEYRAASEIEPAWMDKLNSTVMRALAGKERESRAAEKARISAKELCQATRFRNPQYLLTLAAAHAESGDFPKAVQVAHQALDLAEADHQEPLARVAREHLARYERKQTLRGTADLSGK